MFVIGIIRVWSERIMGVILLTIMTVPSFNFPVEYSGLGHFHRYSGPSASCNPPQTKENDTCLNIRKHSLWV